MAGRRIKAAPLARTYLRMRIVFISTMNGSPWGGSEELWSRAAVRLRAEGNEVSASVNWWPKPVRQVELLERQGVRVSVRNAPARPSFAVRTVARVRRKLGAEPDDIRWMREQRADLVVISQGSNLDGWSWMEVCARCDSPYAAIVQANYEYFWPSDPHAAGLLRAYRGAERVFCVSKHNLDLLERQLAGRLANAEVVWNPWNVADQPVVAFPREADPIEVACVARLEPQAKGQDILFDVLSMPEWRERRVCLNLYGSGPFEQGLRHMAADLGLRNVVFHGQVSDIADVWRRNQLLVLPSRFEGLPLSLVEAMWCGRPAVVTDVAGNTEACVDGETGFVAEAPTAKLFGNALERAWRSRDQWEDMGKAARRRIEKIAPSDPVEAFCRRLTECVEHLREAKGLPA